MDAVIHLTWSILETMNSTGYIKPIQSAQLKPHSRICHASPALQRPTHMHCTVRVVLGSNRFTFHSYFIEFISEFRGVLIYLYVLVCLPRIDIVFCQFSSMTSNIVMLRMARDDLTPESNRFW